MPPSCKMIEKRQFDRPIVKAQDETENKDEKDSLERFLDEWDMPHGGDVAGGIDKTDGPQDPPGGGGGGQQTRTPDPNRFPNTFPGNSWPPEPSRSPIFPYPTPSDSFGSAVSTPSFIQSSSSDVYALPSGSSTICLTDTDTSVSTRPTDGSQPELISETVSYLTVTADGTGTVTDTATIVISGEATNGIFPQHDKGDPPPNGPSHKLAANRLRDILLGVFLGAGMVILLICCIFIYRRYKRKKRIRASIREGRSDSEQAQERAPEMQTTGTVVTMPSMADAQPPDMLPPPPPFAAQAGTAAPPANEDFQPPGVNSPEIPIIINPFLDPTYNSSSGIEDYVVSNAAPLGREPENPFLHPDDRSMDILEHPRPNSAGDFPPEYATVDGNPVDASGRRVREERFPFGDEALSVRTESEAGSIRNVPSRENIPEYQYDDPNGVADGFRYNPAAAGRFPR
ncbi:hypothetical protein ABW19_dt0210032 [Dactylella cylindrospora]|nr:hypothetical protein ABW19_dt0210032 [Dactylella cylindrospora]